jgi:hypothetical protein
MLLRGDAHLMIRLRVCPLTSINLRGIVLQPEHERISVTKAAMPKSNL